MNQVEDTNEHNGYVLYCKSKNMPVAIGVVSCDFRRKAISDSIPSFLKDCLIQIEDKRFYNHKGIDFKSVLRAFNENFRARKIVQGGSTITQQLARNLKYNNKRNLYKKLGEAYSAIRLEINHSKDEILDLYFNNIYFGNNLYGIRSASLYYFLKEPYKLTHSEQLVLLTLLRGPNLYTNRLDCAEARFKVLNNLLRERKAISIKNHKRNSSYKIKLEANFLEVFDNKCIPYLSEDINHNKKIINTTLDVSLQNELNQWVKNSKYPVSIICIEKGKVVAASSTYGSSHLFSFKTNVGSTLKPFIYTFLRNNQFTFDQLINTDNNNNIGWSVREATLTGAHLTLAQALFLSNNNAFINACFDSDLENLYSYLSLILQKDKEEFLPSSILGATKSGITLYELARCYYNFFCASEKSTIVLECLNILNKIAVDRLDIDNVFLKTGTTNDNKERFAVFGNSDKVFAVLRGDNLINDTSKEGNFISSIKKISQSLFGINNSYKWNR
ncbi:MAG: transglycosylase domain-containing protein [Mucilaginibacter sp.]